MKSLNKTMKSTTIVALFASALWVAPASATSSSGFSRVGLANGQFGTLNVNTESDKTGKWGMLLRTKDDSVARKLQRIGDGKHEVAEVVRSHTGVSTELIDLVRRGFNENVGVVISRLAHRRFQHRRVSRTDRVNPGCVSGLVVTDRVP